MRRNHAQAAHPDSFTAELSVLIVPLRYLGAGRRFPNIVINPSTSWKPASVGRHGAGSAYW